MRWRRAVSRMVVVVCAAGVMWVTGFYSAQSGLDLLIGWLQPTDRYTIGHALVLWLRTLGPVDVAFIVGGLTVAAGSRWMWQAIHDRTDSGRAPSRVAFGAIPRQAAWFQARPVEQAALAKALKGRSRAALVALPGARGTGKSQLAAAYARRCIKRRYALVAWVNAENGPVSELALLAERLGLRAGPDTSPGQSPEQLAALAIEKVGAGHGRRLLVFDNVDDPDEIKDFLPERVVRKVMSDLDLALG